MILHQFQVRGTVWSAWTVLLICCVVRSCGAQTIHTQEMAAKLHVSVHLRMGKTTLGEVTKALSRQTGQTIECADYLMEHRLTVQVESVSAEDVLNQLAELNNWKWTESDAKHVRIARARAVVPEKPLQIPAALKAVLPLDVQQYLGVTVLPDARQTEEKQMKEGTTPNRFTISSNIQRKISDLRNNMGGNAWTTSRANLSISKKYGFAQWTPQVREAVLLSLIMDTFKNMEGPTMVAALNEEYDPYVRDPMLTEITIHRDSSNKDLLHRDLGQDMLMLGTETLTATSQRYQGFGSNMKFILTPLSTYLPMP